MRAEAASALGGLPSPRSLTALMRALDDPLRTVRLAAAWAFEELAGAEIFADASAARLKRALNEEDDPFVACAAFWALTAQGGSEVALARFRLSDRGQAMWRAVTGR